MKESWIKAAAQAYCKATGLNPFNSADHIAEPMRQALEDYEEVKRVDTAGIGITVGQIERSARAIQEKAVKGYDNPHDYEECLILAVSAISAFTSPEIAAAAGRVLDIADDIEFSYFNDREADKDIGRFIAAAKTLATAFMEMQNNE